MSLTVGAEEMDRAVQAGRVQITGRANSRVVRCIVSSCRKLLAVGEGRRLYIDATRRGFIGPECRDRAVTLPSSEVL